MVYGVFSGIYSDWFVLGYFDNREDADKYCCVCGYSDCYVEPLKNLSGERDLSQVKLKYEHKVTFWRKENNWIMQGESDNYKAYIDSELHCNHIEGRVNWISFMINIDHNNRKLAEKIAQDYLTELRSYGDGEITQENIQLMNDKFVTSFKERERIKKEQKLRDMELAELKRLKEKYE